MYLPFTSRRHNITHQSSYTSTMVTNGAAGSVCAATVSASSDGGENRLSSLRFSSVWLLRHPPPWGAVRRSVLGNPSAGRGTRTSRITCARDHPSLLDVIGARLVGIVKAKPGRSVAAAVRSWSRTWRWDGRRDDVAPLLWMRQC